MSVHHIVSAIHFVLIFLFRFLEKTTENFTSGDVADLIKEMEIMKQLRPNKHLIQLLAVCTQKGQLVLNRFVAVNFLSL